MGIPNSTLFQQDNTYLTSTELQVRCCAGKEIRFHLVALLNPDLCQLGLLTLTGVLFTSLAILEKAN